MIDSALINAASSNPVVTTDDLTGRLSNLLLADRRRLESLLQRIALRETSGKIVAREKIQLFRQLAAAESRFYRRVQDVPNLHFPASLPISRRVEEIVDLVKAHQVTVICGETGSGKSTQLPKICLAAGRGRLGTIAHTQPRRIAARSIAARVAAELGVNVGSVVGYRVRFDEKLSEQTLVKVMTDGMLLAEIESDRQLLQYDTIIIDEAHERSLNIDFLLGYLKNLLPKRPELRLLITSATLEIDKFSRHFRGAPVLEVSGRTFPVEIRYHPSEEEPESPEDSGNALIQRGVEEALADGPGDILVFLPGEREIREAEDHLSQRIDHDVELIPLYGRLSAVEQQRIFAAHHRRRIVLSTNIAETSLTVPGIRYVVDAGTARISRYSPTSKVQRLLVEMISRASAEQRAGRCGRVADGVCLRLYGEENYLSRASHTEPEILRTSLASVVLRMEAMQLGRIEQFPFIDPPGKKQITAGYRLLRELDALDSHNRLTPTGKTLARLPVDPRIGRMMLAGSQLGCLKEVLVIAAVLESNDPRVVPHGHQQEARQYHRLHPEADSDFLTLLFIWNDYCAQAPELSRRELRRWCEERFLSSLRMREWSDLHRQLRRLSREGGLLENSEAADVSTIHKALLAGLLGHVAQRDDNGFYRGSRNKVIALWPASRLARSHERWIMAAELTQTTRVYARHVAAIRPEWIDEVAPHQLRYSHAEPRWSPKDGKVIALESATLWGLKVINGRRVNYGQIGPAEARAIFIRDGLAEDAVESSLDFVDANRGLRRELEAEEQKLRCSGMLLIKKNIVAFFEERIPVDVVDIVTLEKWFLEDSGKGSERLFMARSDIVQDLDGPSAEDYPDWWFEGESRLPLRYAYNPGGEDDGITLEVPLYLINQLREERVERLVPGYLKKKITVLLKTLPKALRRQLVPLPDAVTRLQDKVAQDERPLLESLVGAVALEFGVSVTTDDFTEKDSPNELNMRVAVISDNGVVVDTDRDIDILKSRYGDSARASFGQIIAPGVTSSGQIAWEFGNLPEKVVARIGASDVAGYPALVDEGGSVGVDVFDTLEVARQSHRLGLYRLLLLQLPEQRRLLNRIPDMDQLCLLFVTVGNCRALCTDLQQAVLDRAFSCDLATIRSRSNFESLLDRGRGLVVSELNNLRRLVLEILESYRTVRQQLTGLANRNTGLVADVEKQLTALVFPGFVTAIPDQWLQHLPRYLAGVKLRLEKSEQSPDADKHRQTQIAPFVERVVNITGKLPGSVDSAEYRWAVEEFRISIFAQELGTAVPVSAARLEKLWAAIGDTRTSERQVTR